jgi:hypothetical protein
MMATVLERVNNVELELWLYLVIEEWRLSHSVFLLVLSEKIPFCVEMSDVRLLRDIIG